MFIYQCTAVNAVELKVNSPYVQGQYFSVLLILYCNTLFSFLICVFILWIFHGASFMHHLVLGRGLGLAQHLILALLRSSLCFTTMIGNFLKSRRFWSSSHLISDRFLFLVSYWTVKTEQMGWCQSCSFFKKEMSGTVCSS